MAIVNKSVVELAIAKNQITIKELLVKANCSMAVWRNVSSGKSIRLANAGKIAKALDLSVESIIIGE